MGIPELNYHEGTLILKNWQKEVTPPLFTRDERSQKWRAQGYKYRMIIDKFNKNDIELSDRASSFTALDMKMKIRYSPYNHQQEALNEWKNSGSRGVVVLPTGSGKSLIALQAINEIKISTLIVSPTIDLMNQWYDRITDAFDMEVGILGGGYHEVKPVTVTTYDSAYRHIDRYGNCFGFLVVDEVHHLPAPSYIQIAELCMAPYRLGLTATYKRGDKRHYKITPLMGPIVYERRIKELSGKHLSDYEIRRIQVSLTEKEKEKYEKEEKIYYDYVQDKNVRFYGDGWDDFIKESSFDLGARKALLAREKMRQIAFSAKQKLNILESLLKQHKDDQVLIFTQNNELVYEISKKFIIPAITHKTKTKERKEILSRFRREKYRFLVTSKVLNEGVDVPVASVAVILGGSANPTEHTQRLGRILRKKENKKAVLYEVTTEGTQETGISYRRRDSDAYR